eukprot:CAMPEP_0197272594 /NCGR_PEP_ID=MMETSP1432-20130617/10111_1 /TAXON_ID=44447 /ORGANISM="Pseudo-nitzschia delicatissima, Strain UNC1205" /LENGTH=40 /DNA_ID= /DNA_START= /DNA_END= /DNA_ORIENTATION=
MAKRGMWEYIHSDMSWDPADDATPSATCIKGTKSDLSMTL